MSTLMKHIMRTTERRGVILIRICVGAALALDGARVLNLAFAPGQSRLSGSGFFSGGVPMWMGILEILAGVLVLLGLLTRVGAGVAVVLAGMAAFAARQGIAGLSSADNLTMLVHSGGLAMLGLYLALAGGGTWSFDASLARKVQEEH